MTTSVRALSLGAGVQSTTVLLLSLDGTIPAYEHVIFADTQDEPEEVYTHLARLQEIAKIDIVTNGRLSDTVHTSFVPVPLFAKGKGMGQRQCTSQFKIRPVRKHLRSLGCNSVDLAMCISTDEILRAKDANVKWCRNVFPLLDLGWSRQDCLAYLRDNWPHPVPRSACVYCPYKSGEEWIDLRVNHPRDWEKAVAFDEAARPFGYVHVSRVPLREALLDPVDDGQMTLECEGMCGM